MINSMDMHDYLVLIKRIGELEKRVTRLEKAAQPKTKSTPRRRPGPHSPGSR